jgi:hypothetical protein
VRSFVVTSRPRLTSPRCAARTYTMRNSKQVWTGVPIIAAK